MLHVIWRLTDGPELKLTRPRLVDISAGGTKMDICMECGCGKPGFYVFNYLQYGIAALQQAVLSLEV